MPQTEHRREYMRNWWASDPARRKRYNKNHLSKTKSKFDAGTMERASEAKCTMCDVVKPASEFYKSNTNRTGLHGWCKDCSDRRTTENCRKRLGISPDQFLALLVSQGSRCAICGIDSPGPKKDWNLDHDHVTGRVRGILCNGCNPMLGYAKDSIETLKAAITYLEKHDENQRR